LFEKDTLDEELIGKLDYSLRMQLSVITCTKNSIAYLEDLLSSIEDQTELPFEHIFVDAASTDGTLEVIHAYRSKAPYPVKIQTDQGQGISEAMNLGASHSSGSHLLFLHSDDLLNSRFSLSDLYRDMAPESVWYTSNCLYIDKKGNPKGSGPRIPRNLTDLHLRNLISHPSTVMKRAFFSECGGFDPSFKIAMDYDLWLRAIKLAEPQQSEKTLSSFRIHGAGASSGFPLRLSQETLRAKLKNSRSGRHTLVYLAQFGVELLFIRFPRIRPHFLRLIGKSEAV
jgi:glycosyltransferase involved in cell wall biosynthesis